MRRLPDQVECPARVLSDQSPEHADVRVDRAGDHSYLPFDHFCHAATELFVQEIGQPLEIASIEQPVELLIFGTSTTLPVERCSRHGDIVLCPKRQLDLSDVDTPGLRDGLPVSDQPLQM